MTALCDIIEEIMEQISSRADIIASEQSEPQETESKKAG